MFGADMGSFKETDKIHVTFCKKLFRIPRRAMNKAGEIKYGRNSRRRKVHNSEVLSLLHMKDQNVIRDFCERQVNNLSMGSRAMKFKKELEELGFGRVREKYEVGM
jgi:hypothetical protein